jgi:hypothetical protein
MSMKVAVVLSVRLLPLEQLDVIKVNDNDECSGLASNVLPDHYNQRNMKEVFYSITKWHNNSGGNDDDDNSNITSAFWCDWWGIIILHFCTT